MIDANVELKFWKIAAALFRATTYVLTAMTAINEEEKQWIDENRFVIITNLMCCWHTLLFIVIKYIQMQLDRRWHETDGK